MLLTHARYQVLTGDTTTASAAFEVAASAAQDMLEDELGRIGLLESGVKSERLPLVWDGTLGGWAVFPTAVPITDAGADHTAQGAALVGVVIDASPFAFGDPAGYSTVSYTGGYSTATVPAYMERDLAAATKVLLDPVGTPVPAGATSIRLGDAAVTFAGPQSGLTDVGWSRQTLRHRKRRV